MKPSVATLTELGTLRRYLGERGLMARQRFSQNFLLHRPTLERILEQLPTPPGPILEIGPGPGVLTSALLDAGYRVSAIELDVGYAAALESWHAPQLQVHQGDALAMTPEACGAPFQAVVGNLPYAITSPLLGHLLPHHAAWPQLVVMVQAEVAERICAPPGSPLRSPLSLFVQCYAVPTLVAHVERNYFYPAPNVDSAVLSMQLHPPPPDHLQGLELARRAFSQKRKMLRASLRRDYGDRAIAEAAAWANILPSARPAELSLEQWARLANHLSRATQSPRPAETAEDQTGQ